MFRYVAAVSYSKDLKKYGIKSWSTLMFIGVLGIIFSFFLLWNPLFAGMTAVLWIGIAFIPLGVFNIILS
ncbi:hypothetical protein [Formosa maritima]|uniref:Uncharacterized protein n=1 Tax=Formosa maritima TaxID=2592046 RepID=A0A5D0G7P6_9FLAO|nr:hypothetical protein [Formosa maritima]TYA54319.1 hypothetical protein FVF61_08865 [Formosa maritima]